MRYRMQIQAAVMFDVEADTDAEAVEKAKAVREEWVDGWDWDGPPDGRVYIDDNDEPDIADVDDEPANEEAA